jgi:pSer/pThr/pTyr-binding forkhead associated (FHA) protein
MGFDETTRAPEETEGRGQGWAVVVLDRRGHEYHPLPDKGSVSIGRGESAALRIDRPWISRSHAVLHMGPPLAIEDLGGQNGVRVNGAALKPRERRPLTPGDTIVLGTTMIVVQGRNVGDVVQPALALSDFRTRVEQECVRAGKLGLGVDVVAVVADAEAEWDVRAALAATHSISVLCVQPAGPFLVASLRRKTRKGQNGDAPLARKLDDLLRARGIIARVDGASYPDDGESATELIERASARAASRNLVAAKPGGDLHEEVSALERQRIVDALATCGQNQSQAAKMLGIARNTLIARMKAFGLNKPRSAEESDREA